MNKFLVNNWKTCAYHSPTGTRYGVSEDIEYVEGLLCHDVISKDVADIISKVPEMIRILQDVSENCVSIGDYDSAALVSVRHFLEKLEE